MRRIIAHILTSIIAFVILCLQLSKTTSVALLLWFSPQLVAICMIIILLIFNLKNKPVQIKDSLMVFCVALISTNFCVVVSLFGNVLPLHQNVPLINIQAAGAFLNILSMPFYIWALFSLGRGFTILPEANSLSMSGIYKISRHPLYLTYIFWCITQIMIYQTWTILAFSVIQIVLYYFRARCEEEVLVDAFPQYEEYMKRVMWLGARIIAKL